MTATHKVIHGDSREVLARMRESSVAAIVTDPPYELGFMAKSWDKQGISFDPKFWSLCLRVLKPGGHLVSFAGTRTQHRIACAIEDAGFEIRDTLMWLFGSGFPKSLDVSKAIDKHLGKERTDARGNTYRVPNASTLAKPQFASLAGRRAEGDDQVDYTDTEPATPEAAQWDGWGTALKPAYESIILARKPLDGTVAENVLEHSVGGINVDGTRIGTERMPTISAGEARLGTFERRNMVTPERIGRWPANVILDEEAAAMLDEQAGERPGMPRTTKRRGDSSKGYGIGQGMIDDASVSPGFGDSGGPSRFFYSAKAGRLERELGLMKIPPVSGAEAVGRKEDSQGLESPRAGSGREAKGMSIRNTHPT